MANILTVNPIVLDTVGATSAKAGPLRIGTVIWSGIAATDWTVALHNAAGGVLILAASSVDNNDMQWDLGGMMVKGLYLTTLGGGTLYVYIK